MKKVIKIIMLLLGISFVAATSYYAATNYAINASKIGYTDNSNLGANDVQAAIDGTCTKFSAKLNNMMEQVYPIGSIYLSTSISDPKIVASTLGIGTWVSYGSGKTLVGVDTNDTSFSTVEKTGGSKSNSNSINC